MGEVGSRVELQYNLIDVSNILLATDGDIVIGDRSTSVSYVSIDSRDINPPALFVPLIGENLDGHDFIENALKNGARIVVVDTEHISKHKQLYCNFAKNYNATFVSVENTLKALQQIAAYYLHKMCIFIRIGVTGSSGKTTVKEMIAAIFVQAGYRTFMTEGNFNSATGVPLSIFKIRGCCYDVAVFEVGMNRKGEIKEIVDIISPVVAVVTNVGSAHIGNLGSRKAIADEKKEIFSRFTSDCLGIIPDCEFTNELIYGREGEFIILGSSYLKRFEGSKSEGLKGCTIKYDGIDIHLPLLGEHNIYNAICAIAVAEKYSAITKEHIKAALEKIKAPFGRAELKRGFTTCLFDCYNANPDSMGKAIDIYNTLEWSGRKVAVLGSMLELGVESLREHENICALLKKTKSSLVFLFGDEMLDGWESFAKKNGITKREDALTVNYYYTKEGDTEYFLYKDDEFEKMRIDIKANVKEGDFVLLKASHGLHFERLEEILVGGTRS